MILTYCNDLISFSFLKGNHYDFVTIATGFDLDFLCILWKLSVAFFFSLCKCVGYSQYLCFFRVSLRKLEKLAIMYSAVF